MTARPGLLTRIGLVVHPQRDSAEPVARLGLWAREHAIALVGLSTEDELFPPDVERRPEETLCEGCELVIALGGDGTILRAMRLAAP